MDKIQSVIGAILGVIWAIVSTMIMIPVGNAYGLSYLIRKSCMNDEDEKDLLYARFWFKAWTTYAKMLFWLVKIDDALYSYQMARWQKMVIKDIKEDLCA